MVVFNEILDGKTLIRQVLLGQCGPGSYYYPCMMQFIFLFPLIYFAICKWDFKGLILCGLANFFYEVIKVPLQMSGDVFRVLVFRYIFAISLGCYFSIGKKKLNKWIGITSVVFGAVFIYAVCYGGYKPIYFSRWSRTSMLAVFYIAPIAYLLIKKGNWECKVLALFEKASYNICFVQMLYFYIGNRCFGGIPGTFYLMLKSYVVCILAGLLFYQIETPITKKVLAWNAKRLDIKS